MRIKKLDTDADILQLLRNPSQREEGFTLLVQRHQQRLYWVARRVVETHEDADDVLQDSFINIMRAVDGFRGDSSLFSWMYTIVRREALAFAKKKKKQVISSTEAAMDYLSTLPAESHSIEGDEILRRLHAAVGKLPAKQKKVFEMRFFEEIGYREMSDILGTSVGALKASYHHATRKIENELRHGS